LREGHGGDHVAMRLAEGKALAISTKHSEAIVIGGDQVLVCGDRVFSKAADRDGARQTLLYLRNREHSLISAAVLARNGAILWRGSDSATLAMREFSDAFLESYLDKEMPGLLSSVG